MAEFPKADKAEHKEQKDPKQKDAKQPKDAKLAKGEKAKDTKDYGPDFRYLVRLVNTDLDGKKPVGTALQYVPGVSRRLAVVVARQAGVDPKVRMGDLKDAQIEALGDSIDDLDESIPEWMRNRRNDPESGEDMHLIGSEIQIMLREDLNRLKKIRSWRGHRHEKKLPTRGQRTKNNGRFGSAVGVQRKDIGAAATPAEGAAPAGKTGGGGAKPLGGAKPAAAAPAAAAPAGAKPATGAAKPAAGGAKPAAPAGGKK